MNRIRTGVLLGTAAMLAVAMCSAAQAKTYHPNKLNDPVPNGCRHHNCSLREAVIAANNHPGADKIVLRAGKRYKITLAGSGETNAQTGDLNVKGSLSVRSGGRARTSVDFNGIDNGFDALSTPSKLSLHGIAIVDAIYAVLGGKRLTVSDCAIHGAQTDYGVVGYGSTSVRGSVIGKVNSYGVVTVSATSRLTVAGSRFKHSGVYGIVATGGSKPTRISHVRVTKTGNPITVTSNGKTTVDHVRASHGSAVGLVVAGPAPVALRDSSFDHFAGGGGVMAGTGNVTVRRSRFVKNKNGGLLVSGASAKVSLSRLSILSNRNGPGLVLAGSITKSTISQSTFSGNRNPGSSGGGAVVSVSGKLDVSNSTFSGNRSDDGAGAYLIGSTKLSVTNSTFANNRAAHDGGGLIGVGGGGATVLRSLTIAGNRAGTDNAGSHSGGGMIAVGGSALKMFNSVIALNKVGTGSQYKNCVGTFTLARNNVRGSNDGPGCAGFTHANGNRVIRNPKLGKLHDNGGPTKTMCPQAGSPLIGKAKGPPSRDQRGRKRKGKNDIGACESK